MERRDHTLILLSAFALGATATITQLVMMREMLCAFTGNELVLGIVLGNWLLLTGLGAWAGRWSGRLRKTEEWLVGCLYLIGLLPSFQLLIFQYVHRQILPTGVTTDVFGIVLQSLIILAPFCFLSGFTLALASHVATTDKVSGIGAVYGADCWGSVVGGGLLTFLLIQYFSHKQVLVMVQVCVWCIAVVVAWRSSTGTMRGFLLLLACGSFVILWVAFEFESSLRTYAGHRALWEKNSPYGNLLVVEKDRQYVFVGNGIPVISTHNIEHVEETVHFAMAQRPGAKRVLLLGGGVSGTAREILKYGVEEVTCVELDPLIIEAGKRFLPENLADPRIRLVNTDGRLFVKQSSTNYDVIIVDMPDPSTSQLNRFYTAEFFAKVKRVLAPDGVLSFAVGRYANYVSPSLARLLATAHTTARSSFHNVQLLPGGRVFFVASDGALSADIAGALERAGVATQLMKRSYLDVTLAPDRLADIERAIAIPAAVNRDFSPVLYFHQLRHWMSQFPLRVGLLAGVLGLLFLAYVVMLRPVGLVIFASGFAGSALSVVLLLGFQILAGSLYRQVGVIVTVFMAGLAIGAWLANRQQSVAALVSSAMPSSVDEPIRRLAQAPLQRIAFSIAGMAVVLPWALRWLGAAPLWTVHVGVALLTFVLALLVGMEFPVAARIRFEGGATTASRLYTADFVGACLGALLSSTLLIPVLGVTATCLLVGGLNALAGALLWWRRPS